MFSFVSILSTKLILVPLVVTACIACANNGDLDARMKVIEAVQSETAAQSRKIAVEIDSLARAQLIPAIDFIDRAGIHQMDEDLQKTDRISPRYLGTVRNLKRVVSGTLWPPTLKNKAGKLGEALAECERALASNDLTAVREAVRTLHASYHPLVDAGWKLIGGEPVE